MKRKFFSITFLIAALAFVFVTCKKDEEVVTIPVLNINTVSDIQVNSVAVEVNITSDGGASITERGVCWSQGQDLALATSRTNNGEGKGSFTSNITNLTAGTTYYVWAYAINKVGIRYSSMASFTTAIKLPVVKTQAVRDVTEESAICDGKVTDLGGAALIACGFCWSTSPEPTIADRKSTDDVSGTYAFSRGIWNLIAGTTYYVRAYATTIAGTGYGNSVSFTTIPIYNPNISYGSLTDQEGNVYKTVNIGSQTWMAENLATTKYNDGNPIECITEMGAWTAATTGTYNWYDDNASFAKTKNYGALYNWYAVETSKLCPIGWHVPTDDEWTTLENYLANNGYNFDGTIGGGVDKIAKALASGVGWQGDGSRKGSIGNDDYPQYKNKSGFTAVPAGNREGTHGLYLDNWEYCVWWTSTKSSGASYAYVRFLFYDHANVFSSSVWFGVMPGASSVRCIKD
ncbi:MAG: hypothetical protein EHM93_13780 [Bacteroidales bacterium]|nr:MAG: hypothetical protein EHM93_13780 [Bacteroidales bacterium]